MKLANENLIDNTISKQTVNFLIYCIDKIYQISCKYK